MWPDFLHHITLHFAIVLPMVMALLAVARWRHREASLDWLIRHGSWATLVATTLTMITGLAAGGFAGGGDHLTHHRYLGILTFLVVLLATLSFEIGHRRHLEDLKYFGLGAWWIASFSVVGAGHYGGLTQHFDVVPF